MKLIMRADDLGISEGVNCGICKAIKDGVITSVGLMPNMEHALDGYEMIKDCNVSVGQHTNICLGKPLCSPEEIRKFDRLGYTFRRDLSSESEYVFERK